MKLQTTLIIYRELEGLLAPTPPCEINQPNLEKTCSSVVALRLSKMQSVFREILALPFQHPHDRKGKSRTPKQATKKKTFTSVAVLWLRSITRLLPIMFQSWTNHEIHDWVMTGFCTFMTGRLRPINFARGGRV